MINPFHYHLNDDDEDEEEEEGGGEATSLLPARIIMIKERHYGLATQRAILRPIFIGLEHCLWTNIDEQLDCI